MNPSYVDTVKNLAAAAHQLNEYLIYKSKVKIPDEIYKPFLDALVGVSG